MAKIEQRASSPYSADQMKRIAFLVSGGDAPGIRACLFAILSAAPRYGMELLAVPHGLDGLIDGCFEEPSIWVLRQ